MRRRDQEITSRSEIEAILREARVAHLGMVDAENKPYVVPLNFGYRDGALYFHGAVEGRKMDILRERPTVCFEVTLDDGVVPSTGPMACGSSTRYRSVIGWGTVVFLHETEQKRQALDILMSDFAEGPFEYAPAMLEKVAVFRLDISEMTGKQAGQ